MKNKYEVDGNVIRVFINHKGEVLTSLFDVEDFPILNNLQNTITIAKGYAVYGYRPYKGAWVNYLSLHRLILNPPDDMEVDHINRNRLDNRKNNLRIVTRGQNLQNQKVDKRNKLGVRGVYWREDKKLYCACLRINGKLKYLGSSRNLKEAENIAIKGRKKYFTHSVEQVN